MINIGIIGDVHLDFDDHDLAFFNSAGYDLLLFVGDLGKYRLRELLPFARQLSRLTTPSLLIPGNHDAVTPLQMLAELKQWSWLAQLTGRQMAQQVLTLQTVVFPIQLVGYSQHPFLIRGLPFDIIAARPHAMGGSDLSYAPYLQRRFRIRTMTDSASLLCRRVEQSHSNNLIFLAHNGPHGLGNQPADIWGCDFDPTRGDFGDADLTQAIAHAQTLGKRVIAVIAGHMHQHLKGGGERQMHVRQDDVHYINAAIVPRIVAQENGRFVRHHVQLSFDAHKTVVQFKSINS